MKQVLYHGSPKKIVEELVPKKAKDLDSTKQNMLKGVYATDIKDVAITMGIVGIEGVKTACANLSSSKKPIAIIKTGDRNISFVKINKYNSKYFATKDGLIFELDDEYEYRYKNTGIYFYNFSNSKPISLTAMSEIEKVIREEGESELFNKDRFMNTIGDNPSIEVNA